MSNFPKIPSPKFGGKSHILFLGTKLVASKTLNEHACHLINL
jgi:hypothetical protein